MTALTLLHTPQQAADWLRQRGSRLQTDSRKVQAGDLFIAWPGAAHDARRHVQAALQQGAAACLVEAQGVQDFDFAQAPAAGLAQDRVACYAQIKPATGPIAAAFYGQPSRQLAVLAVTGTNGKTSTAWWLAQALARQCAAGAGVVGTLGVGRFAGGQPALAYTGLTTPDPVLLQQHLRQFADAGVRHCVLEASSIGIEEHRLDGTEVRVALFTNFTQDHLDYHGSMEAYWQAKRRLFAWPGLRAAVIHVGDRHGAALAQELQGGDLNVWTTSCAADSTARLQAQRIRYADGGLHFDVLETGASAVPVRTALIGQYNVANLLGVLAALRALGFGLQQAVDACAALLPVPGRMECITAPQQPLAVVDYAHTPDALEKTLAALRPLASQRGGRLWCVFGCGGDRDPAKRPLMAQAVERAADRIVVTSDNPRSEDPQAIIAQVLGGLAQPAQAQIEADRARAIASAIAQADSADVVLVAGKGHEDYQEIHGVHTPFSDQTQVRAALARRAATTPEVQP